MKTMLFNPYTGKQRDPRDIASDPEGTLMLDPDEPLRAAVAQPVADERAASILRDLVKLWDSENISEDDFNEEMVRIENAARAELCQPAEEGDKE